MAIIQMLKREGYAGVTVVRGVACFGASNVIYSEAVLVLPSDLPVMVTIVDRPERIETAIASLGELAPNSLITIREVEIVQSRISTISGGI
jgi:PII-like signaling protein